MKAWVYLNEGEDHFSGFKPEHMLTLEPAGSLNLGDVDDPIVALENVFAFCNGQDPQSDVNWYDNGYRSLSVGDVVTLQHDDGRQVTYVCEPSGWRRLPGEPIRHYEVPAVQ